VSFDQIETGSVVRYPYLWAREAIAGERSGRKDRPAVGVRLSRPGGDRLVLFAITSRRPGPERFAVEIPDLEKRRAGLDSARRLWIILDEYNTDIIGRSFHLRPELPLGKFGKAFFLPVLRAFMARRMETRGVDRRR
jgi:hypothetical protein